MDRRFAEMESGKVKGLSLDELEAGARQLYNKKRKKTVSYTCWFHPLTQQDYDEAYAWYENKQEGLVG